MRPFVINLDDAAATDAARVGAKAARLAALRQAGFPVPAGFIVPADVFRIAPHGEITPDVEAAIESAYAALGDEVCVAVRSSAAQETGVAAAAAGRFATFLGIVGVPSIVRHIERCWQSGSGPRAQAYYQEAGIEADQVAMAVLVQTLVDADATGVMGSEHEFPSAAELSAAQVSALVQLGQQVSEHVGATQIEWAWKDNQCWILGLVIDESHPRRQ